jgi:type II secretory pathway pseudopilin PulG
MRQYQNQAHADPAGPGLIRRPLPPAHVHVRGRCRFRGRGLTLVELVVVLVVLVALGAIIVPLFSNVGEDARDQATRATLARVAEAIDGPGGYAEVMQYARDEVTLTAGEPSVVGYASGLPWPSETDLASDGRADHPQLTYLFRAPAGLPDYDPATRIGWRGDWLSTVTATPYQVADTFSAVYGLGDGRDGPGDDDLAPLDGWGNPIVIQLPDAPGFPGITEAEIDHVRLVSAGRNGDIETPDDELAPTDVGDDVVLFLRRENP